MTVSPEVLLDHLSYSAWAGERLLAAAAGLTDEELNRDFGTADKSIVGTLAHIFAGDRIWLARLFGQPAGVFLVPEERNLEFLHSAWPPIHEKWLAWAAALSVESPNQEIVYRDLKGKEWRQPAWQIVMHLVNHGSHHRGQVSGFFRSMGHNPPGIDLVYYHRKQF